MPIILILLGLIGLFVLFPPIIFVYLIVLVLFGVIKTLILGKHQMLLEFQLGAVFYASGRLLDALTK